jgi:agmatine deiminase
MALAKVFPGRKIVMLRIDAIANGGGGVHCLTQQLPATGDLVAAEVR